MRRGFVLSILLILALAVRGIYVAQIWNSPVAWMHQWEESDMSFFDSWAKRIAAGDWLTSRPTHPYPQWTKDTAERYFALYPERKAEYEGMVAGNDREPYHKLWDDWYCAPCLHQGPAYPYLLAVTYKLFGPDPRYAFLWQMLLGAVSALLVYAVTLRLFDDLTAGLAGLIYVFYGPILLYEGVLLRTSIIVFTTLLVLYTVVCIRGKGSRAAHLAAGLAFGFALLVKKIFFPVTILYGAYLFLRSDGRQRLGGVNPSLPRGKGVSRLSGAALFLAGVAIFLLPVALRNASVGAPLLALSSVNAFASTFINSNAADSAPWQGYCISGHFAEIAENVGASSIGAVVETLKTHDSLSSVVQLFWRKWLALWHWYEQPNNINFYYYQLHAPVLSYVPFTFLTVAPLGIVGLFLAVAGIRKRWPVYVMALMYLGILMLGLVLSRYRLPLAALLIPFAAWSIVWIAASMASKGWRKALAAAAAIVLVSLVTMRPLEAGRPVIRSSYYSSVYHAYYSKLAVAAIAEGRWDVAAEVMVSSLAFQPGVVDELCAERPARTRNEAALAKLYAEVYGRIAEAFAAVGDKRRAEECERVAGRLSAAF